MTLPLLVEDPAAVSNLQKKDQVAQERTGQALAFKINDLEQKR